MNKSALNLEFKAFWFLYNF